MKIINNVLAIAGITVTAETGIALYRDKVVIDIVAKYIPPDENGVRIAELNEMSYSRKLWEYTLLTGFYSVDKNYVQKA